MKVRVDWDYGRYTIQEVSDNDPEGVDLYRSEIMEAYKIHSKMDVVFQALFSYMENSRSSSENSLFLSEQLEREREDNSLLRSEICELAFALNDLKPLPQREETLPPPKEKKPAQWLKSSYKKKKR